MSSEENDSNSPKRKRDVSRLQDSPASTSSGSPIIQASSSQFRCQNNTIKHESIDSENSENSGFFIKRRKIARVESDSDFTTESDSSPIITRKRIMSIPVIDTSEMDSSSSDFETFPRRTRRGVVITSDTEEDWDSDISDYSEIPSSSLSNVYKHKTSKMEDKAIESDSSDGQSEKCPICLASFRGQEIGVPENCDHKFCLDCIQEWSKNGNTCPIDRKEFHLISVWKSLNGEFLKVIPIERPQPMEESVNIILEDPTFCEICGSNENEDRLLLCDGCDLGFHLYCLTPPLDEVPVDSWYCNECGPRAVSDSIDFEEVVALIDDADDILDGPILSPRRRNNSTRMMPRTRQSEIIRRRVQANRRNQRQQRDNILPSTSNGNGNYVRRTTGSRKRRNRRLKTVWVVNELGEAVQVKKRVASRKRKQKRNRKKSSRRGLSSQIGMCGPRNAVQSVPNITNLSTTSSYSERTLPRLDIYGTINRLDNFVSYSDEEGMFNDQEVEGVHTLLSRASNTTNYLRNITRRKSALINDPAVSSSTDILDSIMESQSMLFSKGSVMSVLDSSGKLIIEDKNTINNNSPSKPDFNAYRVKKTPWHGRNYSSYKAHSQNSNWSNNRNWDNNSTGQNSYRPNETNFGQSSSNNFTPNFMGGQSDLPQDYTRRTLCEAELIQEDQEKDNKTPETDDVDIYGDIENESLSTSKADNDFRPPSPAIVTEPIINDADDDNDSESGMVIDTEQGPDDSVSSIVGVNNIQGYSPENPTDSPDKSEENLSEDSNKLIDESQPEASNGSQDINQSTELSKHTGTDESFQTQPEVSSDVPVPNKPFENDDGEVSDDGCPNFSIYSRQSKSVALTTDISLTSTINASPGTDVTQLTTEGPIATTLQKVTVEKTGSDPRLKKHTPNYNVGGLYSDSEDESVVKKIPVASSFAISDLTCMTEDILSEEDRSYTPVLDEPSEKPNEKGLDGLDTEMISDDDRNDFEEPQELTVVSDGDALEINAKESELDFTRPEDFEEGEIVDKNKEKKETDKTEKLTTENGDKDTKTNPKGKEKPSESVSANKENVLGNESFKKLTKTTRERNYRDKDKNKDSTRERSKTPSTTDKDGKRKKEKRKELERYNVRAIIAEKPRPPPKDQFGRDLRRTASRSRSRSRSYTPPSSPPKVKKLDSKTAPKRKSRSKSRARTLSRGRRSSSRRRSKSLDKSGSKRKARSRSRSGGRKRDISKTKKRKRSTSRSTRRKKSKEKTRKRVRRSKTRKRPKSAQSHSISPRRSRRDWTLSLSKSPTPQLDDVSPSWTPPRMEATDNIRGEKLTVTVNNETAKKKKYKRNKEKKRKEDSPSRRRRRDRDQTPPPHKEVHATGDKIYVRVCYNNESETRDISTRDSKKKKDTTVTEIPKRVREKKTNSKKDLSGVKPVAIIDLERSPFQEIVSSPKDVIVLSDSDNNENDINRNIKVNVCDSTQQVASPERSPDYSLGPKTPPEPSVKFSLLAKPPQLRAISNPLHDPLENAEEKVQDAQNNSSHKGPNTPPEEPPISPSSSPDAYDPFEPTKSRSQTPEPGKDQGEIDGEQNVQIEKRSSIELEKSGGQSPDLVKSLTPPMPDIQPADSQNSTQDICEPKSPINTCPTTPQQTITKPIAQTTPFQSTIPSSTPVSSSITISRINILSSTILTPTALTLPQRIVLPNQVKSSPVKIPPTKAAVKSTPIKPIQAKPATSNKVTKQANGNSFEEVNLDFESPYSPGSSDYEDLFEPPSDPPPSGNGGCSTASAKNSSKTKRAARKPTQSSSFDALFGSPNFNKKSSKKTTPSPIKKGAVTGNKTKHVGVKVDEDSLKILEELPNSAVEMQVKDKFLKKLNRQERVVEEVKLVLKPYYNKKKITKDEYKDIMRRAVPKICHNKSGEINPIKIRHLIEAYVKKVKHNKKVTSSSSLPQKVV